MDFMGMMKKAQAVQAKLAGGAGGTRPASRSRGRPAAAWSPSRMTAKGELKGIGIDPSLLTPSDKEMVEDLIVAAFADAKTKADRAAAEKMQSLTEGLPLPPGMKLPF